MSSAQNLRSSIYANSHASDQPGFRSYKTTPAINYPKRWLRDLLAQAIPDPSIMRMEPASSDLLEPETFGTFIEFMNQHRLFVDIMDFSGSKYIASRPDSLNVTLSFGLEKLRCSMAREIWRPHSVQMYLENRIKVLHKLTKNVGGQPP